MRVPSADLLRRHLPVAAVPSLPELRLHRAGPHSGLGRLLAEHGSDRAPYWAHLWSGGLVLARYILDRPELVAGRRVLDLGCGSGLVAVAAARCGARVLGVDVDPFAGVATALNAALNGVSVTVRVADILEGPVPPTDVVVVVGDLFYDAALARRVTAFLDRAAAAGCLVLVGDPGRAFLPQDRLAVVHATPAPEFGAGVATIPCAVYRYGLAGGCGLTGEGRRPAGP